MREVEWPLLAALFKETASPFKESPSVNSSASLAALAPSKPSNSASSLVADSSSSFAPVGFFLRMLGAVFNFLDLQPLRLVGPFSEEDFLLFKPMVSES